MKRNRAFEDYLNTPNLISYTRVILLLPIILVYPNHLLMLLLFGIAALSDWADGFVARRQNEETKIGALVDPLCDKVLFLGLILFFFAKGDINFFQAMTLFIRDLFVFGLILFSYILSLYDKKVKRLRSLLKGRMAGKITTVLVFISLFWVIAGLPFFEYFIFVVLLSSAVSIIDYSIVYGQEMVKGSEF